MRLSHLPRRRRFAALASAFAITAAASFVDLNAVSSAFAAENSTPPVQNAQTAEKPGYAIIASSWVLDDADWSKAVEALKAKHSEKFNVVVIRNDENMLGKLRKFFPKYACYVVKPEEASRANLAAIWQTTRALDDDPYGDVIWGIITGFNADDALRMAQVADRPTVKAAGGTAINLDLFEEGVCYDEGAKNRRRVKKPGAPMEVLEDAPDDTTRAIAESLDGAQLFVTSGHATQRDWMLGYNYKNGFFVSKNGQLYGKPSTGEEPFEIHASGSKIYLASGNCLIGDIDGPNAMALAYFHSCNVDQMVGYVVPTWFGYMGWGTQGYYLGQPGRFTVAEAFFANNQALLYLLDQKAKGEMELPAQFFRGLNYDRDVFVLYGDPAWQNALVEQESGWAQTLKSEKTEDGRTLWTLAIEPKKGAETFNFDRSKGSHYNNRPFVQLFPTRVADPQIVSGAEFNPVVVDNFILVPQTEKSTTGEAFTIQISTR